MEKDNHVLICEFLGFKFYESHRKLFDYENNWNDLMNVVYKIESIYDDFHGYFGVHINSNSCTIQGTRLRTDPENPHYAYYNQFVEQYKITATYKAVVEFIKWYNENLKK